LVILTGLFLDLRRPPSEQLVTKAALAAIHAYHRVSPTWMRPFGARCRFHPTCSVYAQRVIRDRGLIAGAPLVIRRLLRCGPWTPAGTVDKPPPLATPTPRP
jgi:uncharacterized protein